MAGPVVAAMRSNSSPPTHSSIAMCSAEYMLEGEGGLVTRWGSKRRADVQHPTAAQCS